jgi:hypothetical protein
MVENVRSCDFCDTRIPAAEFETGGAVVLLGRTFCPGCIKEAIRNDKPGSLVPALTRDHAASRASSSPTPGPSLLENVSPGENEGSPEVAHCVERRGHERYIPPRGCDLALKPAGLGGVLVGNVVTHWLEISPDGLRAIVSRKVRRGDLMEARIAVRLRREVFTVQVVARHVSRSQKYPGSYVAGLRFVDPSDELRACVREDLCRFPAPPGRPAPHPVAPRETPAQAPEGVHTTPQERPGAEKG